MTESELINWAQEEKRKFWVFYVSDKFGDSGLTGVMSMEYQWEVGKIVDFVLSCRVMGRNVEETMLAFAIEYARAQGIEKVEAEYIPTQKNRPCLDFLNRSGLVSDDGLQYFSWKVADEYPVPEHIQLGVK
jgi:FkbH-like protein